ncbi:MAG: YafY family protein [Acidobacteriota bacterium]
MRRTDRLFAILQRFRRGHTVRGRDLAASLGVSLRTIYRDIDTLIASGIPIEGARGVGYMLRAPIFLPPLALTDDEFRALRLGVEVLRQTSDPTLAQAADDLLDKIAAVAPAAGGAHGARAAISGYAAAFAAPCVHLSTVRAAVAARDVLTITYRRLGDEEETTRAMWPLQAEFWGRVWTCTAWCELRRDFRAFRIDRIVHCTPAGRRFPDQPGRRYADYLARMRAESAASTRAAASSADDEPSEDP